MRLLWTMLALEVRSIQWHLAAWLLALSSVVVFARLSDGSPPLLLPFLPLMLSSVISQRVREKRERLWALMPVSRVLAGTTRVLLTVFAFFVFLLLLWALYRLLPGLAPVHWSMICGFSLGLLGFFCLYYLIQDGLSGRPRMLRGAMGTVAGLLGGALFSVTLIGLSLSNRGGDGGRFVLSLTRCPLFHGPWLWTWLPAFCLVLSIFTVVGHGRRRSFTE